VERAHGVANQWVVSGIGRVSRERAYMSRTLFVCGARAAQRWSNSGRAWSAFGGMDRAVWWAYVRYAPLSCREPFPSLVQRCLGGGSMEWCGSSDDCGQLQEDCQLLLKFREPRVPEEIAELVRLEERGDVVMEVAFPSALVRKPRAWMQEHQYLVLSAQGQKFGRVFGAAYQHSMKLQLYGGHLLCGARGSCISCPC
jgi:hypothetical protein